MTDYFAALQLPRRAWFEPAALKAKFLELAAQRHPDALGTGDSTAFTELNKAFHVIREPSSRLRHLLELKGAPDLPPHGSIPSAVAESFMPVSAALSAAERLRKKQATAASPLAVALLASERAACLDGIAEVQADLERRSAAMESELPPLDLTWLSDEAEGARRLAELAAAFAYVGRWLAQLREAQARLVE